jgi:hypothetical protein
MKELCVPLPFLTDEQVADVEVSVGERKNKFSFRLESFPWAVDDSEEGNEILASSARIESLRKSIESYDKKWEIVQIFTPEAGSKHIQVLFRQRG